MSARGGGFTLTAIVWGFLTASQAFAQGHVILASSAPSDGKRDLVAIRFDAQTSRVLSLEILTGPDESIGAFCARGRTLIFELRQTPVRAPVVKYTPFLANRDRLSARTRLAEASGLDQEDLSQHKAAYFAVSNDQTRVAFTLQKDINYLPTSAIYIYDLRTKRARQVVPFGHWCEWPVFSPDDQHIAFYRAPLEIWREPGNGNSNDAHGHVLCTVQSAGGEVRALSPPPNTLFTGLYHPPCWSPDGNKILFVAQYNDKEAAPPNLIPQGIYLYDLRDGGMKRLTPTEKGAQGPSWSPDGRRFAYWQGRHLRVMDISTRESSELDVTRNMRCNWAPFTDLIAYVDGENHLSVITPDGSKKLRLFNRVNPDTDFYWVE